MKKVIATLVALAAVMSLASCGGDTTTTSSATSTPTTPSVNAPVSSTTTIPITPPSTPSEDDTPEAVNLAIGEGATAVDMNTGKAAGDEGYKKYYGEDAGNSHSAELAFDENESSGWQTNDKPDADGNFWLGVTFAETTKIDSIVVKFEKGSAPATYEEGVYKLEYTTDGEAWVALENVTVGRTEADPITTDTAAFDAIEVKGVRIVLLAASSDGKWSPKVWEFEVYAPVDEEVSSEAASENASETVSE